MLNWVARHKAIFGKLFVVNKLFASVLRPLHAPPSAKAGVLIRAV